MNKKVSHLTIARSALSIALSVALLLCFSLNTFAAVPIEVAPCAEGVRFINVDITFAADHVGTGIGTATKSFSASSIDGKLYMYEQMDDDWEYINEWTVKGGKGSISVSGNFVAHTGDTYKAIFVVTAYVNSTPVTQTIELIKTCDYQYDYSGT